MQRKALNCNGIAFEPRRSVSICAVPQPESLCLLWRLWQLWHRLGKVWCGYRNRESRDRQEGLALCLCAPWPRRHAEGRRVEGRGGFCGAFLRCRGSQKFPALPNPPGTKPPIYCPNPALPQQIPAQPGQCRHCPIPAPARHSTKQPSSLPVWADAYPRLPCPCYFCWLLVWSATVAALSGSCSVLFLSSASLFLWGFW